MDKTLREKFELDFPYLCQQLREQGLLSSVLEAIDYLDSY
jgi:hypothetical protein